MKYSTYVALTATVSVNAENPNKIIDGAAFEAFQKDALQAGRDVAKLIDEEVVPNYNQWFNEQGDNEREFMAQER